MVDWRSWDAAEVYEEFLVPAIFGLWAERLVALADPRPGERALDVACGTGAVTRLLGPGAVGVDLSPGMLGLARQRGGAEFVEADAADLPFEDGSFDLVTCQQGLQFFPDRPAALREWRRTLRLGGRLALACWAPIEEHPAFARLAVALGRRVGPEAERTMHAPYGLTDAAELRGLLEDAGFHVERLEHETLAIEFPSAEEFVRRYGLGSMLAPLLVQAGPDALQALADDVRDGGEPFACPMGNHLALARV